MAKTEPMKLTDRYSLDKDKYQWILVESITFKDKDGNDKVRTENSYHSTLVQVAHYLVDNNEFYNLSDYINTANSIKADIEQLLKEIIDEKS